eukprot:Gb_11587 [translate_table: standard]
MGLGLMGCVCAGHKGQLTSASLGSMSLLPSKAGAFLSLPKKLVISLPLLGGPKLRKWYGASDLLPRDGIVGDKEEDVGKEREQEDIPEVRDAVLVTDGDNETAQLVILSLIIKRARIKALVKDRKAAIAAFGNYIEPIAGDITDKASVKKALKGVRAIICTTKANTLGSACTPNSKVFRIITELLLGPRGSATTKIQEKASLTESVSETGIPATDDGSSWAYPYTSSRSKWPPTPAQRQDGKSEGIEPWFDGYQPKAATVAPRPRGREMHFILHIISPFFLGSNVLNFGEKASRL